MVDPLLGAVVAGRYEILERVGEGGIGAVYRARRVADGAEVAVKVLSDALATDPSWVKRFENEALAASRLAHPNTVRVLDWGRAEDGRLWLAMEFLVGHPLRRALAAGPMEPARVLRVLAQACASLAEAHERGVVHRDLKPDNLFLLPDGTVKLLDFSVAKLKQGSALETAAGVVFGTPQYMSPEQGRGFPVDGRSDLYGLGVLAFEMLTGRVPFDAKDPMDVLAAHVQQPVPPMPGVPGPVAALVLRCLAKDPAERPQTAAELGRACEALLAPAAAAPASPAEPRPSPLYWSVCLLGGVITGLLAYLLIISLAGCAKEEPGRAPPAKRAGRAAADDAQRQVEAIQRCQEAMARVGAAGDPRRMFQAYVEGCRELHRDRGCREAWAQAAAGPPEARLITVAEGCRRASCPGLPPPKPRLCDTDPTRLDAAARAEAFAELNAAILARDLGLAPDSPVVAQLARLFRPAHATLPTAPDAGPPARDATVHLRLEGDRVRVRYPPHLEITVPVTAGRDELVPLEAALRRHGGDGLVIATGADVPYAVVVAVMDAAQRAGIHRLALATEP